MTGGAGVFRSAWMLYQWVGRSFSSSRNFVRVRSTVCVIAASLGARGGGPADSAVHNTERCARVSTGGRLTHRYNRGSMSESAPLTIGEMLDAAADRYP